MTSSNSRAPSCCTRRAAAVTSVLRSPVPSSALATWTLSSPASRRVASTWSSICRTSACRLAPSSTPDRRVLASSMVFIGTTAVSMRSGVLPRDRKFVHEIEHLGGKAPLVIVVSHHGVGDPHLQAQCLDLPREARVLGIEHEAVDPVLVVTRDAQRRDIVAELGQHLGGGALDRLAADDRSHGHARRLRRL